MTIARISVLALTLLLLLALACSSEDTTEPTPAELEYRIRSAHRRAGAHKPAGRVRRAHPAPAPTAAAESEEMDLEIVTLLPFDAIPAVLDPTFISAEEADAKLTELLKDRSQRDADKALLLGGSDPDDALVLGLSINGDSRAYYVPTLSRVEIVNDTVGGQPLAVTW